MLIGTVSIDCLHPLRKGTWFIHAFIQLATLGRILSLSYYPMQGPLNCERFLTPVTARLVDPVSGNFVSRVHVPELKPVTKVHDQCICFLLLFQ